MLLRLALAAALLPAAAVGEESGAGFNLGSEATLGWTSNAEAMAGGGSDMVVEHSHSAGFTHSGKGFALRGALNFAETRYRRLWQENDRQAGAELVLETALSPESLMRAELALTLHEDGQAIWTSVGFLAAQTPYLKGRAELEFHAGLGEALAVFGLRYGTTRHGETAFDHPALVPFRTRADTTTIQGDLRLSHRLDEHAALTGLVMGFAHMIPEADRRDYGRIPLRALRLAGGIEAVLPLRSSFTLEAGADIVWMERAEPGPFIVPYMRSETTLALAAGFDLRTMLGTRLDLENPADGLADWVLEGRAAIGRAIGLSARLEAALFASAARSLGFDIEHKNTLGAELSARTALGDNLSVRAALSQAVHSGLAPSHEETRLGLTLAAAI
ncbi:hypothetical protein [Pelagibacterium sediminicola]|uniref:hypothetical protein n=1 Tax=Pelagibacterium sediminicola TaxID=2248761 RepID=UPI001300367B|nr:hypothetical protein [Pelagibacterium sediminicola]